MDLFTLGFPPSYNPVLNEQNPNTWTDPPANEFLVRGPNYLKQTGKNVISLKQPSQDALYTCVGLNVFKSPVSMEHCSAKIGEFRRYVEARTRSQEEEEGGLPLYLVICWMFASLWGTDHTLVQFVFKRNGPSKGVDTAVDAAVARFMANSDDGKNEQFKYIFRVIEGPFMMTSVVSSLGGERPVLIGRRLSTRYFKGKNYLEIDMDVGSNYIASMLNSVS